MIIYAIVGEAFVVRDLETIGCVAIRGGDDFERAKRDPRGMAVYLISRLRAAVAECDALLAMAPERHEVEF
jgi:hypothetical protein